MLHTSQFKAFFLAGLLFSASAFADDKKDAATTLAPAATATAAAPAKQPVLPAGAPLSSATCMPCHSGDGNSDNPAFPKLSGLSAEYILKELKEFKKGADGHRNNAVMLSMVSQLSDKDMDELAQYYSKQARTIGVASATNIELGKRIYRSGNLKTGVPACSGCHLPDGSGNVLAGFPRLSGQNPQYITEQLHAFKSGDRSNDINGIMQGIAAHMSDEEIEAVSNYVSGLH